MHSIIDIVGNDIYEEIKSKEVIDDDHHYSLYIHIVPKELTNLQNNKYYVGITMNKPEERWKKCNIFLTDDLPIKEGHILPIGVTL